MGIFDFFRKKPNREALVQGMERTREGFFSKIWRLFTGGQVLDDEMLDRLETLLIEADTGVDTTAKIIRGLQERSKSENGLKGERLQEVFREEVMSLLRQTPEADLDFSRTLDHHPHVILVVGVNGVGKTTSIGKLAWHYRQAGKKVVMGAADTFRAAAIEQLQEWSRRADSRIVTQKMGSDPASVAFDTLSSAQKHAEEVVLIDTAGRLHNKSGLMQELGKVRSVMSKVIPEAPHEVLLVLDASTGQNALEQARIFGEVTKVTGLILTKLDGTARGGIVVAVSDQLGIPVRYIGVGEKAEHLQPFDRQAFVDALFSDATA